MKNSFPGKHSGCDANVSKRKFTTGSWKEVDEGERERFKFEMYESTAKE